MDYLNQKRDGEFVAHAIFVIILCKSTCILFMHGLYMYVTFLNLFLSGHGPIVARTLPNQIKVNKFDNTIIISLLRFYSSNKGFFL